MALRCKAKATFIACMLLVFAFQEMGDAAEWSASPSIRVRKDYDDNIYLSTQPVASVTSTWVVPKLDFGIASDIWKVDGGAELAARRFPGHDELDSDSQSYSLGYSYMTERSKLELSAKSSKISYLAGPKISPDIGLFTQNTNTDTKVFSPSWTWSMTELTQLQLTYSKSDVSYVNGESVGLFDYGYSSLYVQLINQFDIDTQIFLIPGYSIYRVPAAATESKTTSYQVGITRTFSETMNGTLALGGRDTSGETQVLVCKLYFGQFCVQTAQETMSARDSGRTYNVNLEKKFETVDFTAAASRSFNPSGGGQQVITDSVSFSLSRPFTEKITGYLDTDGYNYNYRISPQPGRVSTAYDYKIYQTVPHLRWQMAREWHLDGGYRYTSIRRDYETTSATSKVVYLTLAYYPLKMSISR